MNKNTLYCKCGRLMVYQIGMYRTTVLDRQITLFETPYYMCEFCKEIEFKLLDNVPCCLAWAYRNNIKEILYIEAFKNAIKGE